jgi:hypothetical protein
MRYASAMQVVAIAQPGDVSEAGLRGLSVDLGTTLYELRLLINAGFPAVVLATAHAERALAASQTLARFGHRVVSCERSEMTPSADMTSLRDLAFEDAGILASASTKPGARLRYDAIGALVRATHRSEATTTSEVKERKLRPGMAILSSGLIATKTVKRDVTTTTVAHESVLYLFPRDLSRPFILREREARYDALGAALRPTSLENFAHCTERLRALAPSSAYDDRLKTARPIRGVADGILACDWYAHLIARDAMRT